MDYLHLTSKESIKSILKNGIIPTHIDLPHHWESFHRDGLTERKCVYLWNGESYNNTKFIKDMIYTKMFIQPRNKLYNHIDVEIDFRQFGKKLYGEDMIFYLLRVHELNNEIGSYIHVQEPSDDIYNTITMMNDKYAHDDKPLVINGKTIKSNQFNIVERINVRLYKTHQLGFTFAKYKN